MLLVYISSEFNCSAFECQQNVCTECKNSWPTAMGKKWADISHAVSRSPISAGDTEEGRLASLVASAAIRWRLQGPKWSSGLWPGPAAHSRIASHPWLGQISRHYWQKGRQSTCGEEPLSHRGVRTMTEAEGYGVCAEGGAHWEQPQQHSRGLPVTTGNSHLTQGLRAADKGGGLVSTQVGSNSAPSS